MHPRQLRAQSNLRDQYTSAMHSPVNDRRLLYGSAFLRALATGFSGVLLGFYLAALQFDASAIGIVVGIGLGGVAAGVLVVTVAADRLGHRRLLQALTLLSVVGALAFAFAANVTIAAIAAFVGMVNGMGRDRSGALVLEQAILPATVGDAQRTRTFAVYHLLQDIGHALGALLAAIPGLIEIQALGGGELGTLRSAIVIYAVIAAAPLLLYARLSANVEPIVATERLRISPQTRAILWKISSLFALDSLGGGFLTTALLTYFFHQRFGVGPAQMGVLFFLARIANAASHVAAAWLAKRIGLVNTMVFTHIPSSLLLVTVAFAPSFPVAAALFLLREGLVEMDVPTRQSYLMAIVRPEERTTVAGVTHLVRLAGWALAPLIAGFFMQSLALATPLFVGAAMKIAYDVLLYRAFKEAKPPEETVAAAGST
jgi:MFS family permease